MTATRQHQDFPRAYDHRPVEQRLYRMWMDGGYFTPPIDWNKQPFVVIMPPPNVTGELHLGHAMTAAIQDAMVRWHRMRGEPTLWLPGTDHAGIATQVVVERALNTEENVSRHELGREQFIRRVWAWVDTYGNTIDRQHMHLGASCDWSRKRFTLDPGPSLAVRTTFVNLYRMGLIYQGERIINWCPRCRTALSDLEVKHEDEEGQLYYIRYPLEQGGHVTVATTRPETMLGDTAVAVHPDNPQYRDTIGKNVVLPIIGRVIPVIADDAVEIEFGTGALKVTPGHDPTDFEIGQRHGLPIVSVMNLDGTLNQEAGPYMGRDRYEGRHGVVEQLRQENLLETVENNPMSVGHCDRCDTVIEPLVSEQWFMRMRPLAEPAIEAVRNGSIRIVPQRFDRVYENWMEKIRDWCISRQLWWGHRIPVWYCDDCGELTVEVETPERCGACDSANIHQDPDVLDTWFSSGLWTHSTLGWPEDTDDLRYFYPTSVMETGYDILFFWVARMVMLGIANMGRVPFHTIYLHGLVRDPYGAKMSKSRGNVVDPLQAADDYGADALRFALTTGMTPGNDTRISDQKMEAARNFANKLWNASRFVVMSLEGVDNLQGWQHPARPDHREDRWIVSQFNRTVEQVNRLNEDFMFGEAQREIHDFIWGTFCDWYIEMAKVRIRSGDKDPVPILAHVLEGSLRLLHPFMPFVTEEIWQRLTSILPSPVAGEGQDRGLPSPSPPRRGGQSGRGQSPQGEPPPALIVVPYPEANPDLVDPIAEEEVDLVTGIIRGIRNVRAEFKVDPRRQLEALVSADDGQRTVVAAETEAIKTMARVGPLRVLGASERPDAQQTANLVFGNATVYVPLGDVVDLSAERQRLERELSSAERNIRGVEGRVNNREFLTKAPEEVVEKERERLATLQERVARVQELLAQLG